MSASETVTVFVQPRNDRVVIRRAEAEQASPGGILYPDSVRDKEKPQRGVVLAVGPGAWTTDGKRKPVGLQPGDVILYTRFAGEGFRPDSGDDLLLVRDDDVIAILEYAPTVPFPVTDAD